MMLMIRNSVSPEAGSSVPNGAMFILMMPNILLIHCCRRMHLPECSLILHEGIESCVVETGMRGQALKVLAPRSRSVGIAEVQAFCQFLISLNLS